LKQNSFFSLKRELSSACSHYPCIPHRKEVYIKELTLLISMYIRFIFYPF